MIDNTQLNDELFAECCARCERCVDYRGVTIVGEKVGFPTESDEAVHAQFKADRQWLIDNMRLPGVTDMGAVIDAKIEQAALDWVATLDIERIRNSTIAYKGCN